ncbi:hypothetical protein HK405_002041, partial [Cladochytrium tenue]
TTLDDPGSIASAHLLATTYNDFRGDDTTGYHADGHVIIGGDSNSCDMGNFYCSPNDPLFYLHHGLVDKTWWKWQQICSSYKTDYEGYMVVSPADSSGVASTSEVLDQWTGYTVSEVLDTLSGSPLCYTYTESDGDVTDFTPPTCPDGSSPSLSWSFGSTSASSGGTITTETSDPSATATDSGSSSTTTSTADAAAQATWLADVVQGLYVVTAGGFSTNGNALVRRDSAESSEFYLPNATAAVASAVASATSSAAASPTYLSDGWMSEVHLGESGDNSTVVHYDASESNTAVVPAGCNVSLIASDRVVAVCDLSVANITSDFPNGPSFFDNDANATFVYRFFFPNVTDPMVQT